MAILQEFINGLSTGYQTITSDLPEEISSITNVFIFAILIAAYAIFTWKFYNSISKKDLIELNLSKYNTSDHPGVKKFFGFIFYILEYMILLPFIIFIWFGVLALLILVLTEDQTAIQVLTLSAAVVAAIRICSYYQVELTKELAKVFPLTVLTVFVLTPNFFSMQRLFTRLLEIQPFFVNILYFLGLIVVVEIVFRILDSIVSLSIDKND